LGAIGTRRAFVLAAMNHLEPPSSAMIFSITACLA
jgi:hypothetical protein